MNLVAMLAGIMGRAALSLVMGLMTEAIMRRLIVYGLEWLVNETETPRDNELLELCKQAWNQTSTKEVTKAENQAPPPPPA
jgi:hypothetical protein